MTNVQLYKTIFGFNYLIFIFRIEHLHKLISPLSKSFIRMEFRRQYVCIEMHCDICGLLFTETTKKGSFKFILCWHNHWKTLLKVAYYCFLKSGENANICILKSFLWIFEKRKTRETDEGLLRTRVSSPLARRETPAEGQRPEGEGANIDRRLVPYHAKCMRIQSRIEFIYIYIYIYLFIYMPQRPFWDGVRRLGTG